MSLQIGIVGLPNVGKSTLFNALTSACAAVSSYPFTTIDPNIGVVEVPDPRLLAVAAIVQPDEIKAAAIEFVDIAGLVQGAHKGEGLGNQFLGHIRNVDAVGLVVRCFEDPDVAHVTAVLDPLADCDVIDLELALADLATVERREEKARSAAKAQPREHAREFAAELALLERLRAHLESGQLAAHFPATDKEAGALQPLNLLTAKPRLYIANVGEDALPGGGPMAERVAERAQAEGAEIVVLCAQCEADLAEWPPDEAAEYRAELGLEAPGLDRLIRSSYHLLDLITFFTATGTSVVRAWNLERGQTAYDAAGKVHTDMQRGFIRAEVVSFPDLNASGSYTQARERGLVRLEGRDYVVQDGDVIHLRFSPPR